MMLLQNNRLCDGYRLHRLILSQIISSNSTLHRVLFRIHLWSDLKFGGRVHPTTISPYSAT